MIWFLSVVYWLFILWEFLAVAKVQQKNETNKKISNKMVTNYKITFHPPALRLPLYRRKPVLGTWSRDGPIIPCFLGLSETKNIKNIRFLRSIHAPCISLTSAQHPRKVCLFTHSLIHTSLCIQQTKIPSLRLRGGL